MSGRLPLFCSCRNRSIDLHGHNALERHAKKIGLFDQFFFLQKQTKSYCMMINQFEIINFCLVFPLNCKHFRGESNYMHTWVSKKTGLDQSELGHPWSQIDQRTECCLGTNWLYRLHTSDLCKKFPRNYWFNLLDWLLVEAATKLFCQERCS